MTIRNFLGCGVTLALVASFASVGMAAGPPPPVPEIDPSVATSAVAVLAGTGLMLAERLGFRRK